MTLKNVVTQRYLITDILEALYIGYECLKNEQNPFSVPIAMSTVKMSLRLKCNE